jgi:hypothetical protein
MKPERRVIIKTEFVIYLPCLFIHRNEGFCYVGCGLLNHVSRPMLQYFIHK